MGFVQFVLAACVSPLMGLAGDHSALPMALSIPVCGLIAFLCATVVAGPKLGRSAVRPN
jgi:DHA1 family bicyclomycin/chloramphenicol resistance-like MFS transporter